MRLLAAVIGLIFTAQAAFAQIVPALPFNLQNNTLADAAQVMANFNTILNGVNSNAAKRGVNSDITALNGITTPFSYLIGGSSAYVGGAPSSGTANAQVISTTTPTGFSLVVGKRLVFIAGATNTGPMTLNIAGTGVKNVLRPVPWIGPAPLAGGEVIINSLAEVVYNGTSYEIVNSANSALPGTVADFTSVVVPLGWHFLDGADISRTGAGTALFALIGISYGPGDGSTTFTLPDARGRMVAGTDGGVGRITGGTLGTTGGNQNTVLTSTNQFPPYTPTGNITPGTYTPAGNITPGTYTPAGNITPGTYTPAGNITPGTYTPAGTIPSFNYTPAGSVSVTDTRTWGFSAASSGGNAFGTNDPAYGSTAANVTPVVSITGGAISGGFSGTLTTFSPTFSGTPQAFTFGGTAQAFTFGGTAQAFTFGGTAQAFTFAGAAVGASAPVPVLNPYLILGKIIKL